MKKAMLSQPMAGKTDEEIICYSQAEAARIIGVHPSSFCEYLSKYGDKIVYRDFYIERVL